MSENPFPFRAPPCAAGVGGYILLMNNFKKTTHDEIVIFKNLRFERSTACDLGQDGAISNKMHRWHCGFSKTYTWNWMLGGFTWLTSPFRCYLNNRVVFRCWPLAISSDWLSISPMVSTWWCRKPTAISLIIPRFTWEDGGRDAPPISRPEVAVDFSGLSWEKQRKTWGGSCWIMSDYMGIVCIVTHSLIFRLRRATCWVFKSPTQDWMWNDVAA